MSDAEAGYEAYLDYFASLRKSDVAYFLEGGQAVNFCAEYADARFQGRPLSPMRPFTSKDCDIWVSSGTWKRLKDNPAVLKGSSPADGQLGILTLSEEPPRIVDILSSVYGIDVKEYPRLLARSLDDGTVRVIDPLHLFLSKCHCLMNLLQADRQDERHVRMMAMILPEYLSLLIEDAEKGMLADRDLLKEIKLLKTIASSGICRRTMGKFKIDPASLIPWSRFVSSTSDILNRYGRSQQPKPSEPSRPQG